mgnify:CR=1 FL=1
MQPWFTAKTSRARLVKNRLRDFGFSVNNCNERALLWLTLNGFVFNKFKPLNIWIKMIFFYLLLQQKLSFIRVYTLAVNLAFQFQPNSDKPYFMNIKTGLAWLCSYYKSSETKPAVRCRKDKADYCDSVDEEQSQDGYPWEEIEMEEQNTLFNTL